MVKYDKTKTPPASLFVEKMKKNGRYNNIDVVELLKKDFYDKCYICELKGLQGPEVEHLIPHDGGKNLDLKFDWNNLFWSCGHCNGVKNQKKYNRKIINCCTENPELHLSCLYENHTVRIEPKDNDEKSMMTAQLIHETFNLKNTGIRIVECQNRIDELGKAMNVFFKALDEYRKQQTPQKKKCVEILLRRSSAFAGFKREYIRKNRKKYPTLLDAINT